MCPQGVAGVDGPPGSKGNMVRRRVLRPPGGEGVSQVIWALLVSSDLRWLNTGPEVKGQLCFYGISPSRATSCDLEQLTSVGRGHFLTKRYIRSSEVLLNLMKVSLSSL